MQTKLTLTLEKEVIELAKKFAKDKGQSLSELVENYFKLLIEFPTPLESPTLSPEVKALKGILKVVKDFDYKQALEEEIMKKHGK